MAKYSTDPWLYGCFYKEDCVGKKSTFTHCILLRVFQNTSLLNNQPFCSWLESPSPQFCFVATFLHTQRKESQCHWLWLWDIIWGNSLKSPWTELRLQRRVKSSGWGGLWGTWRLHRGETDWTDRFCLWPKMCSLFYFGLIMDEGPVCLCKFDSLSKPTHKWTV